MNWLREHMRDQVAKAPSGDGAQNVVHFRSDGAQARNEASSALDLVSQAASVIRGIEERAAESEARARALAEAALEKLEHAEIRIRDAETARMQAEDTLVRLSARLQEAERELARSQARATAAENRLADAEYKLSAAENRLADAEYKLGAAEVRATHSEKAVNQIEDAIRAQIVGLQRNLTTRKRSAA
jgi:chromosome segregation ATPase